MADLNPSTFIGEIIAQSYRLAGVTRENEVLTGAQAATGLFLLNNMLAEWGESGTYCFFISNLEFPAKGNGLDYTIGNSDSFDVNANPFAQIYSLTYNVGNITYTPEYITPKRFNSIVFKSISNFPGVWTYEVQKDYTLVRLYPRTQGGNQVIKIVGKQRLGSVTLFQNSDNVPRYAFNALCYSLADLVSDFEASQLPSNFENKLQKHMNALAGANKFDFEIESLDPFEECSPMGRGRGGGYAF